MHASLKHLLAAGALALGAVACDIDPEQSPPFSPTGTGRVNGQVFFDSDGDGLFNPVKGDALLSGATVTISERGDSASVIASTTTDANGAFSFTDVPVGTHELRAQTATGTNYTCAPIPVTVYVAEPAFTVAPARVSCRIDIVEAEKRALNSTITVGGIVTAAPGVYRATNLYLQDRTGGIQAFNVPAGPAIVEGDSIEVTGPLGQFGSELQVNGVQSYRIVTHNRDADTLQYGVKALRDSFTVSGNRMKPLGELIVVRAAKVRSFATPTSSGTDGRIVQGTDSIFIRFDQAAQARIPTTTFDPAKCYDVVGLLGYFSPNLQLKPRRLEDVKEVACPTR